MLVQWDRIVQGGVLRYGGGYGEEGLIIFVWGRVGHTPVRSYVQEVGGGGIPGHVLEVGL